MNTIFMGKLKAANPQLSVYYNDREHVTIIVQTLHKLSALSPIVTHKTSSDHTYHMLQSAPPICLPLLRNPRWIIMRSKFEYHQDVLRNPHWQSQSMCVQISCTSIVTTDSHTALSPTSSLVSTETIHAL